MLSKKSKILFTLMLAASLSFTGIFNNSFKVHAAEKFNSFISYKIDARLNEKNNTITGTEKVEFKNVYSSDLKDMCFNLFADCNKSKDTQPQMFKMNNEKIAKENPNKKPEDFLGGIQIKSVKLSDGKALNFIQKDQALKVQLDKELKTGETVSLSIEYEIKIPFGMQRLSYYKDIYTGVHWYPVVSVYDDKNKKWNDVKYSKILESDYFESSKYDIALDVPKNFNGVVTGTNSVKEEGDRKIINSKAENNREAVFFASEKYEKLSKTKNGITVNMYYIPESSKKQKVISDYVDSAFEAIEFYSEKFGKYPYPEFDIVESNVRGVAIEYTGVIQLGRIREDSVAKDDHALAHEIGHQWFHGIIGNNSETEALIDEGFTDFATCYFMDKKNSPEKGFKELLMAAEGDTDKIINSPNDAIGENFGFVYYIQGRKSMYDLYRKLGEEKFDKVMQEYFNEYKFKNASVKGFLDVLERVEGKEIRSYMETAWNKPNYKFPNEYKLPKEEVEGKQRKIFTQLFLDAYSGKDSKAPKVCIGQLTLKGINGEKISLVKASNLTDKQKNYQQALMNSIKDVYDFMGIKFDIIEDSNLTDDMLKNSNLVVLGDPSSNKAYDKLGKDLSKKIFSNRFGYFTSENPSNKDKILINYYWSGDNIDEKVFKENALQFVRNLVFFQAPYYEEETFSPEGKLLYEKSIFNPAISKYME